MRDSFEGEWREGKPWTGKGSFGQEPSTGSAFDRTHGEWKEGLLIRLDEVYECQGSREKLVTGIPYRDSEYLAEEKKIIRHKYIKKSTYPTKGETAENVFARFKMQARGEFVKRLMLTPHNASALDAKNAADGVEDEASAIEKLQRNRAEAAARLCEDRADAAARLRKERIAEGFERSLVEGASDLSKKYLLEAQASAAAKEAKRVRDSLSHRLAAVNRGPICIQKAANGNCESDEAIRLAVEKRLRGLLLDNAELQVRVTALDSEAESGPEAEANAETVVVVDVRTLTFQELEDQNAFATSFSPKSEPGKPTASTRISQDEQLDTANRAAASIGVLTSYGAADALWAAEGGVGGDKRLAVQVYVMDTQTGREHKRVIGTLKLDRAEAATRFNDMELKRVDATVVDFFTEHLGGSLDMFKKKKGGRVTTKGLVVPAALNGVKMLCSAKPIEDGDINYVPNQDVLMQDDTNISAFWVKDGLKGSERFEQLVRQVIEAELKSLYREGVHIHTQNTKTGNANRRGDDGFDCIFQVGMKERADGTPAEGLFHLNVVVQARCKVNPSEYKDMTELSDVCVREGAEFGIFVTTYDRDFSDQIKDKVKDLIPKIRLVYGKEFLGLMKKHGIPGYNNSKEAKQLYNDQGGGGPPASGGKRPLTSALSNGRFKRPATASGPGPSSSAGGGASDSAATPTRNLTEVMNDS